jgi:hypothetical protein
MNEPRLRRGVYYLPQTNSVIVLTQIMHRARGAMIEAVEEIQKLEKQLQEATGCLALYLEAEDMLAKQSCDKGTVEFLLKLEKDE